MTAKKPEDTPLQTATPLSDDALDDTSGGRPIEPAPPPPPPPPPSPPPILTGHGRKSGEGQKDY